MTHTIQPVTDADISAASRAILQQIEGGAGVGWNFFLTAAHSPSALYALHGLVRAATRTGLPERVRVAIALRVAQLNACEYCVATHTDRARGAGLDDASVLNYRRGISNDSKEPLEHTNSKIYGPGGAAELLGLKPTTLVSRMKKLGIRKRASE